MNVRCLWVLIMPVVVVPLHARAVDPFTVVAGVQMAGAVMGYGGGGAGGMAGWMGIASGVMESAETGIVLGELLTEIGIDNTAEKEAEDIVRKIEKLNSRAREVKDNAQDVRDLLDVEELRSKSHQERLKQVRDLVKLTKKIALLFAAKPKVAEKALQVQQTQINQMMLEELFAARRARMDQLLQEQTRLIDRKVLVETIEKEEAEWRTQSRQSRRRR